MIQKDRRPIADLDDWFRRAGPKSEFQWKDGRSAKEAARHWLKQSESRLPPDVEAILASHPDFGAVRQWSAEPEAKLPIDGRRGEPRNTDLLVEAVDSAGKFVVAVEAKADEPFDRRVAEVLDDALERLAGSPSSGGVARVADLVAALVPAGVAGTARVSQLRYQLLTAAAGALRFAEDQGVSRAVLLIQEFVTHATDDARHHENHRDLDAFVARLSGGRVMEVGEGRLLGPFVVPARPLLKGDARLYVGKTRLLLRS